MVAELDTMRAVLEAMSIQVNQLAAALQTERDKTSELQKKVDGKAMPNIIEAIRKGHMKEIASRKFSDTQKSGSFKLWAKEVKDYVYWHDRTTREALDYFEDKWSIDDQLTYANAKQCRVTRVLDVEVDFTEGEARVLAENAELTNPDSLTMHKSGLELWRLLKYQFDRTTSFNVLTVLEVIRAMPAAKAMHEVLPKLAGLEKSAPGIPQDSSGIQGPGVRAHAEERGKLTFRSIQESGLAEDCAGRDSQGAQEGHEHQL